MRQVVSVPHSEIKAHMDKGKRREKAQADTEVRLRRFPQPCWVRIARGWGTPVWSDWSAGMSWAAIVKMPPTLLTTCGITYRQSMGLPPSLRS